MLNDVGRVVRHINKIPHPRAVDWGKYHYGTAHLSFAPICQWAMCIGTYGYRICQCAALRNLQQITQQFWYSQDILHNTQRQQQIGATTAAAGNPASDDAAIHLYCQDETDAIQCVATWELVSFIPLSGRMLFTSLESESSQYQGCSVESRDVRCTGTSMMSGSTRHPTTVLDPSPMLM